MEVICWMGFVKNRIKGKLPVSCLALWCVLAMIVARMELRGGWRSSLLINCVLRKKSDQIPDELARTLEIFLSLLVQYDSGELFAEDKVDGAAHAERSPDVVELDWLPQEPNGKGNEDGERDDLLKDF